HVQDDSGGVPVIGSGGPFTTATEHLYDGESVLFGRKGTIDRPIHINGKFWTVDTMFYTELSHYVDGRWLYYWSTTIPFGLYSTDTALPSMTSSTLGRLEVPVLSIQTQRRITDYLDRETSEIDAMIDKLDELDEILRTRRQSAIDEVFLETAYFAPLWTLTKDVIDCPHTTPVVDDLGQYEAVRTASVRDGKYIPGNGISVSETTARERNGENRPDQ